ncbi:hypothetical protein AX16_002937 [Volvariella volvacea WC 439]|nr:hypothetical protein AX16_002937 [Volvariella volvacea WC 439]
MHTGKVRMDALECDPNTRQAIIEDIMVWTEDRRREQYILWLRGPAGIGKSAIAKTTADRLDRIDSNARIAGSFFFFRADPERNNLHRFVPTIAYLLAVTLEEAGSTIDKAIERDAEVLYADVGVQWRKLVVEPIMVASSILPALIIIDGLDECGTERDQRKLLDLLTSCGPRFPIAFLVTSRPEPHIVNCFDAHPLFPICRPAIDLARHTNDWEMKLFIRSSFSRIYAKHRDILHLFSRDGIWPPEHVIDSITTRADGQYIYPVTLFRHIDQDHENPHDRLQECLRQLPEALSSLDALYMQIMWSSHKPDDQFIQALLFLIIEKSIVLLPTMRSLAATTNSHPVQCRFKFRRLHSVMHIPDQDDEIIDFHHRSFIDFLLDPARGCQYYLDRSRCATRVIESCLSQLEKEKCTDSEVVSRWWKSSESISYANVSPTLLLRLENFDFRQLLWDIRAFEEFQWWIPDLSHEYTHFTTGCATWVNAGRRAREPQVADMWRNSILTEIYPPHAFTLAKLARHIQLLHAARGEAMPAGYISTDTTQLEQDRDCAFSLSWKGFFALAESLNEGKGVGWINNDDVVCTALKIFIEDQHLIEKLYIVCIFVHNTTL